MLRARGIVSRCQRSSGRLVAEFALNSSYFVRKACLTTCRDIIMIGLMSLMRSIVVVVAVLWLPMTMHCQLERLPALSFLPCGEYPEQASHQESDCEMDGCAVVESGLYLSSHSHSEFRVSFPHTLYRAPESMPEVISNCEKPRHLSTVPPDFPKTWQFAFRTALLPRAPSVIA